MGLKDLFNGNGATKTTKAQAKLDLWRAENVAMDAATKELRTKAIEIQTQIDAATEKLRAKAADTQTQIDAISAPYLVRIGKLKDQIERLVGDIGASVTAEGAKAQYRKAYTRRSWNLDKLDGYAASHPEILPFKTTKTIASNVSIRLT